MNTTFALPPELSPQTCREVVNQAWRCATTGGEQLAPAREIADHWLDKGGDIYRRAARFILRESLSIALLSVVITVSGRVPFVLLVRQLRLLAVMQYLAGRDLRQETTQRRALEALYGTDAAELDARWHRRNLYNVVEDYRRTYRAAKLFHHRYVAPVFPPLEPLR
ncbi:MAG: hypothetical protein LBU96_07110 [Yokenella regensburgei]|nr:hypothetical protein [Yokenella regensburgei]